MQGGMAEADKEREATRKRSDVHLKKRLQRFAGRTWTNSRHAQYWGGNWDGKKTYRRLSVWSRYAKT